MMWPDSIPCGAIDIQIQFVNPDDMDDNQLGDFKIRNGHATCRIDHTLRDGLKDQTVVHELVHAWLSVAGITLEENVEESVADAIGQGVVQMMGVV